MRVVCHLSVTVHSNFVKQKTTRRIQVLLKHSFRLHLPWSIVSDYIFHPTPTQGTSRALLHKAGHPLEQQHLHEGGQSPVSHCAFKLRKTCYCLPKGSCPTHGSLGRSCSACPSGLDRWCCSHCMHQDCPEGTWQESPQLCHAPLK